MSREIIVDGASVLFDRTRMLYKEFPSDFRQIRYFALLIAQNAPPEIRDINLLEQQVSELIKNAVKHGNRLNPEKRVKVWYLFTRIEARLIVEDEGEGFRDLERWNEFNRRRIDSFATHDFDELARWVAFRTERSDESDGGNALFAALEYWNGGLVFNEGKNGVAVAKRWLAEGPSSGEVGGGA